MLPFILERLCVLFYSTGQWWTELGAVRDVRVVVCLVKHICGWRWEGLGSCRWIIDSAYISRSHGSVVTRVFAIVCMIQLVVCDRHFLLWKLSSLHLRLRSCLREFRLLRAPLLLLAGGTHRHKIFNALVLFKIVISVGVYLLEVLSFPHRFVPI